MNELLREWILGITCASVLLAITESVAPEGAVKRIVNLAGSLILVLVAVSPVARIDENALSDLSRQFEIEMHSSSEELKSTNDFLYESIIQEKVTAYILDKAEELGITCRVSVSVAWDGEIPKPHTVNIRGRWTEYQRDELSRILESELGVPVSLQYFEETEQ